MAPTLPRRLALDLPSKRHRIKLFPHSIRGLQASGAWQIAALLLGCPASVPLGEHARQNRRDACDDLAEHRRLQQCYDLRTHELRANLTYPHKKAGLPFPAVESHIERNRRPGQYPSAQSSGDSPHESLALVLLDVWI